MLRCFHTNDAGRLEPADLADAGTWICLTAPTEQELRQVELATGAFPDFLRAPLDDEEVPRAETDEGQGLIIFDVPIVGGPEDAPVYDTIPLGIIVANDRLITVCLETHPVLDDFAAGKVRGHFTFKRTRFVFQLLLRTASLYLRYLDQIDRRSDAVEQSLLRSTRNEEVIRLLNLSKSLTYFSTSLRSNNLVLEKLLKTKVLAMYPDDEDLLEDVLIENRQATEVSDIRSSILSSTLDAFASIISNNLNIVIRFLTSVTIVLAIPTIVFSFYGMNVDLPFQNQALGWGIAIGISVTLSTLAIAFLVRRRMF